MLSGNPVKHTTVCPSLVFFALLQPLQQALEADEVTAPVEWGLVGGGLHLLRLQRPEGVHARSLDVHLQLQQDLNGVLQLRLTAQGHTRAE